MAFVCGLRGIGSAGAKAQALVDFSPPGSRGRLAAGAAGFEFVFSSPVPLREPVVCGGPFVMPAAEQLRTTWQRSANGEMGRLDPAMSRAGILPLGVESRGLGDRSVEVRKLLPQPATRETERIWSRPSTELSQLHEFG